jgi:hypothetical protein
MSDDATEAREYIALFRKYTLPGAEYVRVKVKGGRVIRLDDMTDADAIFVARRFHDIETQAAKSRVARRFRDT